MTIYRTREGQPPSSGPGKGHSIVRLGNVFVEYSGDVPDQAELDLHLHPVESDIPTVEDLIAVLTDKDMITQADLDARKSATKNP